MPRQRRWVLKRDLDMACDCLDRCEYYISRVGEQFKDHHEEYYRALILVFRIIEEAKDNLTNIRNLI